MLQHGLKELEGLTLSVPRHQELRPDPERLHRHFERFRAAAG